MPNFDGGHYFYTGLFPVRWASEARREGIAKVPSHALREALATLPNFSEAAGQRRVSPFARCKATHFVRLAVIDDPAYNGRDGSDAILGAGTDLSVHQPVDHFSRAWLMMTADFDAPNGSDAARDAWAAGLWDLAKPELTAIFEHCLEFSRCDQRKPVESGADFAAYLAHGQIETTMSFNDYWIDAAAMGKALPTLSVTRVLLQVAVVLAIVLGIAWLAQRALAFNGGWMLWTAAAVIGVGAGLWSAYRLVMRRGARPWASAPNSDLKSVLKGLYLQQRLVGFASEHQGASPDDLHRAFGTFLAEVRPDDLDQPTQSRGVLKS